MLYALPMEKSVAETSQHGLTLHVWRGDGTRLQTTVIFRGREVVKGQFCVVNVTAALGGLSWLVTAFLAEWLAIWPPIRELIDAVCS